MLQDYGNSNNFERRYKVYIEKSINYIDGYRYYKPDVAPIISNKKNFILVFHFKRSEKATNPLLIVDSMDGDNFLEKIDIVNHFKRNHAITYAVSYDGAIDSI